MVLGQRRASLIAQVVNKLPAIRETQVQSLGHKDPLEKGKATRSSILAWRIPWTVSQRVGHDSDSAFHVYARVISGRAYPLRSGTR